MKKKIIKSEFLKAIFTVACFTCMTRCLGFVRSIMQASLLGISIAADALSGAMRLPSHIRRYLGEGGISSIFIPIYTKCDEKESQEFTNCIFSIFMIIGILLFLLLQVFIASLMKVNFPGWYSNDIERFNLLVWISRFILTSSIVHIIYSVAFSLLSAKKKFGVLSSVQLIQNTFIVISLYMMFYSGFIDWAKDHAAGAFLIAFEGSSFISILYILYRLRLFKMKIKFEYRFSIYKNQRYNICSFFKRLIPNFFTAGSSYISMSISLAIASTFDRGIVSCITYADRMQQLPISIIGVAIGNVMLSMISNESSQKKARKISNDSLVYGILGGAFIAQVFYKHSHLIVHYAFHSNAFHADAVNMTANMLEIYTIGLPLIIILKILNAHAFSKGLSLLPLISTVCGVACEIIYLNSCNNLDYLDLIYAVVISIMTNIVMLLILLSFIKDLCYVAYAAIRNIFITSIAIYLLGKISHNAQFDYSNRLFDAIVHIIYYSLDIICIFSVVYIIMYYISRKESQ